MGLRPICSELGEIIEVDESARGLGIFIAYTFAWSEGTTAIKGYPFESEVKYLLKEIPRKYSLDSLRNDPIVRAYRDFYWRIGIDPTKTRPASEALVRRVLRGSFPRINIVVDAGNIASVETLVPIGLYDLGRAKLPLKITLSRGGEVFKPIGGKPETLSPNVPVLVDSRGTVMHVYPHRDSVDTMIREDTKDALIVAAGVPNVPVELVKKAAERVAQLLTKAMWDWCRITYVKPELLST